MGIYNNDYLSSLISGWFGEAPMFNVDPLDQQLQQKLFDFVRGIVPNSQRNLTPGNRLETGNNNFTTRPPAVDFSNLPPYRGTQDLGNQGWVPGTGTSYSGTIPPDVIRDREFTPSPNIPKNYFVPGQFGMRKPDPIVLTDEVKKQWADYAAKNAPPKEDFSQARSRADVNMLADMIMKRLLGVQPYANKEKPLPQLGAYSFLGQGRY